MSQPPSGGSFHRHAAWGSGHGQQDPRETTQPTGARPPGSLPRLIRVAVADDSPLVRQGIEALLATQQDIELVAVLEDGLALEAALAQDTPDVVLLDLRMPP